MLQLLIAVVLLVFTPITFALGAITGPDPNDQGFVPAVALPTAPATIATGPDYATARQKTEGSGGAFVSAEKVFGGETLRGDVIARYLWDEETRPLE
ncbi:MAG: hypothetical protein WD003_01755 [Candidatus Paceibacterota bacterium]